MADPQAPKKDEEKDGQKHDELNNNLLGAAQHGQLDELKRLIAANADPAYQEKEQGISAMMAAAVGGHCEGKQQTISTILFWISDPQRHGFALRSLYLNNFDSYS